MAAHTGSPYTVRCGSNRLILCECVYKFMQVTVAQISCACMQVCGGEKMKRSYCKICVCTDVCVPILLMSHTPAGSPSVCCLLIGPTEQRADLQHSSATIHWEL